MKNSVNENNSIRVPGSCNNVKNKSLFQRWINKYILPAKDEDLCREVFFIAEGKCYRVVTYFKNSYDKQSMIKTTHCFEKA